MTEGESKGVVIAEKVAHKGQLFGHVSSGGGLIAISNGIYLKFTAMNEKFTTIQIVHSGIGTPLATQSWVKTKTIKVPTEKKTPGPKAKPTTQVTIQDTIESEDLL